VRPKPIDAKKLNGVDLIALVFGKDGGFINEAGLSFRLSAG
jgi:hypothetical protein